MTILMLVALLAQAGMPARATISGRVCMRDGTPAVAVRVAATPAPRENIRAAEGLNAIRDGALTVPNVPRVAGRPDVAVVDFVTMSSGGEVTIGAPQR